ncbi:hypothetical protein RND81_05G199300 [Saponaria officinalis]|uniref:Uncharacterized protein n=1 Tax=Saponaria officinalis TaxID=3572 RepID=A0AAW1L0A9_SAPOF
MPNSPKNEQNSNTQKRICDFCGESEAIVYCKADSAKLCLSCDREVHSTNQLFTKHTRFLLCDFCDANPALIFCCTERSVLCHNCDYDSHRRSDDHDRRPLEGFNGRPSAVEMAVAVGVDGFDCKTAVVDGGGGGGGFGGDYLGGFEEGSDGFCELFGWDAPAMVNLDDLIGSTDKCHGFHALVVPPLPKDRNSSCGQHKQEILRQLCELAKSDPIVNQDSDRHVDHLIDAGENKDFIEQHQVQSCGHDEEHTILRGDEARACSWSNNGNEAVNDVCLSPWLTEIDFEENALNSDTKPDTCARVSHDTTGCNVELPVATESSSSRPKVSSHEFTAADRVSAVSRYKEKKRTRRFEKHIRYESRKVQAENRIRIKGRFAKMDNRAV